MTSKHHIAHIKGTPQGEYCCVILEREFAFSDTLETVIGGVYGREIAQKALFHVDGKHVPHHSLLDVLQGKTVTITYTDHDHDRITSFEIPVLHASLPAHHQKH